MKIRILDDHIRLRLEPDEVDRVAGGESLRSVTHFPGGIEFGYQLSSGGTQPCARFEAGTIDICLPLTQLHAWATNTSAVSINESIPNEQLSILIEKDFECLEPREGESQSNRFKRPTSGSQ